MDDRDFFIKKYEPEINNEINNINEYNDEFHISTYQGQNDSYRLNLEKKSKIAHMGEIVVSDETHSILGTTALDTCYGIIFYDRSNKFGIVAHASPSTKVETLKEMIKLLGPENRTIEYSIISGYRNVENKDYDGYNDLIYYLKVYAPENIRFVPFKTSIDIKKCENVYAYEFAFDVENSKSVTNSLFESSTNSLRMM